MIDAHTLARKKDVNRFEDIVDACNRKPKNRDALVHSIYICNMKEERMMLDKAEEVAKEVCNAKLVMPMGD